MHKAKLPNSSPSAFCSVQTVSQSLNRMKWPTGHHSKESLPRPRVHAPWWTFRHFAQKSLKDTSSISSLFLSFPLFSSQSLHRHRHRQLTFSSSLLESMQQSFFQRYESDNRNVLLVILIDSWLILDFIIFAASDSILVKYLYAGIVWWNCHFLPSINEQSTFPPSHH
jgi:hypothetical protein